VRFELVSTRSGARALKDAAVGEVMHPGLGPIEEARRLHVEGSGLAERIASPASTPLVVYDVGLGAGSNAAQAIALRERMGAGRELMIFSFETDLAAYRFALEHPETFGLPVAAPDLLKGLATDRGWEWLLVEGGALEGMPRQPVKAEVLFWDPFSFRACPELWSVRAFAIALAASAGDAVLTTYSSSTTVRTAMLLAGWAVGHGPVLGAGRGTTVAARDAAALADPLDAGFLERRARSSAPWPHDAPPDARERLAACAQFARR
jgi:queuine tRNA-ribosyltransferase